MVNIFLGYQSQDMCWADIEGGFWSTFFMLERLLKSGLIIRITRNFCQIFGRNGLTIFGRPKSKIRVQ